MRTLVSILVGLGLSFALGAMDFAWGHAERLALLSRPIALLLAAMTGTRLEQEWAMVLTLASMPVTLFVIGVALGAAIDQLTASNRPL